MISVRFISIVLWFAFISAIDFGVAQAATFKFLKPAEVCSIARSSRVGTDLYKSAHRRLEERFREPCMDIKHRIEDPFSEAGKAILQDQPPERIFTFWMDLSSTGREVLIRGFDIESGLEWTREKAAILGISKEAVQELIPSLIDEMIDSFPYIGYVRNDAFFIWSKRVPRTVIGVKREEARRHPFIPSVLFYKSRELKNSEGELKRSEEMGLTLTFSDQAEIASLLKNKVWLVDGSKVKSKE